MASTIQQSPAPPQRPPAGAVPSTPSPAAVAVPNSVRVALVVERLMAYFKGEIYCQPAELYNLCFSLARGVDYALTLNDIPAIAHHLPSIIKRVYERRNDTSLQSAITVLLISAKNACKNGWFHVADADELLSMSNELCNSFCMEVSITTEAGNALDTISRIMPRFYPHMKLGCLIVSFEAKPGYDILMADFHIKRNIITEEAIRLFVVQTDNLETSSCIISPPQVSFLVNGIGVDRRTNVLQESGPQFPTDITKMLKYGTNIIQAVGYFRGNYLIAIAFVNKTSIRSTPILKDYVQPIVATLASDSEIIEGPSRISLNCPISLKRIRTPVKGHLCKHHQCFDYDNFIDMNSRKPSWRCPCCNQAASFVDLYIDQNMVKILREAGEDVGDVVIFADGTWKVVAEHNGPIDQLNNGTPAGQQDINMECQTNKSMYEVMDAVDLTMEEDGNYDTVNGSANQSSMDTCETEDKKPYGDTRGFPVSLYPSEPPLGNCATMAAQADAYQIGCDIWARILSATSASIGSSIPGGMDGRAVGTLESILPHGVMNHVTTDAVSPALTREPVSSFEVSQPTFPSLQASQAWQAENMQLQHSRLGSSIISNEAGRPPIPRHVIRNPTAIQALPVQTQTPSLSQRMQTNVLNPISVFPGGSPSASYQTIQPDGFNALSGDMEMQELPRTSDIPITQNRDHQDHQQILNPAVQQVVGLAAPNLISTRVPSYQQRGLGAYRTPLQPPSDHNQLLNITTHRTMSQPTNIPPQSTRVPTTLTQQASQNAIGSTALGLGARPSSLMTAQMAAAHATRLQAEAANSQASRMASSNPNQRTADSLRSSGSDHLRGGVLPPARADSFPELPPDKNWRPTGRMRGSLTGSAYSAALNKYLLSPTQPVAARPPASSVAASSVASASNPNAPVTQHASRGNDDGRSQPGVSGI